jgi:hypothetical protein
MAIQRTIVMLQMAVFFVRGSHCDCSPRVSKSLAVPLVLSILKYSAFQIFFFTMSLLMGML